MPSLFLSRQQWTLFGVLMSTAAMMTYATGTALNGQLRPYADLSVTMRSPTSALPGMTISYAVKIQNAGPTNAVGALRSTMADYMAFQSAKGAKCVIVETELRCPFSLGPRKSMTVTLTFAAAEDAPCNTYSVHGVSVGSPNRADQKPYNNQTSTRTKIVCPVAPKIATPPPAAEPPAEPDVSIPEESSSSSSEFASPPRMEEGSSSSSDIQYSGF